MLGQLLREENLERAAWLSRRSRVHAKSIVQPHGVWRVHGPLHGSEQMLSLVAIGPAGFEHQLAHVFISKVIETERLGQVARFEDRRCWARAADDVVAHVLRPWEHPGSDEFRMAMAVDARITLAGPPLEHATHHLAREHRRAWNH